MTAPNDLIDRLTQRLSIDPELRLEVSQELRAHLEDSTAAFREASYDESQAVAEALKRLGDEAELAEELWQANRKRLRLRSVAKWAARLTLWPVGVALMLGLLIVSLSSIGAMNEESYPEGWTRQRNVGGLSEDHRLIFDGGRTWHDKPLAAAKALVDHWPDDPVYYANYAMVVLGSQDLRELLSFERSKQSERGRETELAVEPIDREKLESFLEVFRRGAQLEPDNAFSDFMIASLQLLASSTISQTDLGDAEATEPQALYTQVRYSLDIHDQAMFDRGVSAFRRGLAKRYYKTHVADMMRRVLDVLPPQRRLTDYLYRLNTLVNWPLPDLQWARRLAKSGAALLFEAAEAGHVEQATEWKTDLELMATKVGPESQVVIESLVALGIQQIALGQYAVGMDIAGRPEQADIARSELQEHVVLLQRMTVSGPVRSAQDEELQALRRGGAVARRMLAAIAGHRHTGLSELRRAEYAVVDQLAIGGLLCVLLLVATLAAIRRWSMSWRTADKPVLLFIGWPSALAVASLSVTLPIIAYVLYIVSGVSGRQYGVHYAYERLTVEYVTIICAVLALLWFMLHRMVRRRVEILGLPMAPCSLPRAARWFGSIALVVSAIAVIVYLSRWQAQAAEALDVNGGPRSLRGSGFRLAGVMATFTIVWMGLHVMTPRVRRVGPGWRWRRLGLWGRALLFCGICVVATVFFADIRDMAVFGVAGLVMWLLCELALRLIRASDRGWFGSANVRSIAATFAIAAVLVGAVGGLSVSIVEARSVRAAPLFFLNEVEMTDARLLRDDFRERHEALLAQRREAMPATQSQH
jgi:hypothetical protein